MLLHPIKEIFCLKPRLKSILVFLLLIISFFWSLEGVYAQYTVTATKTYTSSGTFTITDLADITGFDPSNEIFQVANLEILIVGGGGGGGRAFAAGGGGGGQIRKESIDLNLGATLNITVGQGGRGARQPGNTSNNGQAGGNTIVNLTSGTTTLNYSANGGLGGTSGGNGGTSGGGNAGGSANGSGQNAKGGGGGGASNIGTNGTGTGGGSTGGNGGNGSVTITGSTYGAGGGGNGRNGGLGGLGGGGNANPSGNGGNASANSGSGGGAGNASSTGGNGANGIVIVQIIYRILPVEFSKFDVLYNANSRSSNIFWETSKEWENSHFEIERAVNSVKNWETIARVEGNGYSDGPIDYDYQDFKLPVAGGNIFYRLKQVDFDGKYSVSDTKSIKVGVLPGFTNWRVYPNPTTGYYFNIELLDPSAYRDDPISLRVIAPTGQYELIPFDEIRNMGTQVSQYFENKAAGVYTIEISWGDNREYHKVILR